MALLTMCRGDHDNVFGFINRTKSFNCAICGSQQSSRMDRLSTSRCALPHMMAKVRTRGDPNPARERWQQDGLKDVMRLAQCSSALKATRS
jgi:hypothetical protein